MSEPIIIDALIVGGGCAGLFALNALHAAGMSALLVENNSLGFGQTTSSQGILHAGVKYSLGGLAGDDAKEASDAAHEWIDMLDGGSLNLKNVRVLTRQCYLWRTSGLRGAAGMLGAKLALRTRPESMHESERPAWLAGVSGDVLTLAETVIDPRSLLEELANPHANSLLKGRVISVSQSANHVDIEIESSRRVLVRAQHLIVSAGLGNQDILGLANVADTPMQQRPLRQAMVRGALPMVFGHCIDGAKTRITVTSDVSTGDARDVVWHVGGQIAEDGPAMSESAFARYAMDEITKCIPALAFTGCQFASYPVIRAEPRTGDGRRPAKAFTHTTGRITTIWPVKLVLAPMSAAAIMKQLNHTQRPVCQHMHWPADLPRPKLAARPWETAQWSEIS
ncbi:MAG: FAD-dependent oxidoreductase [Phycisphaerales bacterium]|nr:FAD-dependent oxidoreductase [Phycisphaerales bacterium]